MSPLPARHFDGRSSRGRPVLLRAAEGELLILAEGGAEQRIAAAALQVDEPLGAVRRIGLPDGGHLELARGAALDALLQALGHRESLVSRGQRSLHYALASLLLLVLLAGGGYLWGLPLLAQLVAPRLPDALVAQIDASALQSLEQAGMLRPSWLDPTRKARLQQELEALGLGPGLQLHFRRMPGIGPNAFALPGGSVVLGDELVMLADDDALVAAVLAHEAGHVRHHHGLRMLIQGSVTAVVVGVWLGDFSSLGTTLSALALNNRYSREFEFEADAYAAHTLRDAGRDGRQLGAMLQRLEAFHAGRSASKGQSRGQHEEADGMPEPALPDWLSTHPPTRERIARIEALLAGR